jgi:hypothetical protein
MQIKNLRTQTYETGDGICEMDVEFSGQTISVEIYDDFGKSRVNISFDSRKIRLPVEILRNGKVIETIETTH